MLPVYRAVSSLRGLKITARGMGRRPDVVEGYFARSHQGMSALGIEEFDSRFFCERDAITGARINHGGNFCGHVTAHPYLDIAIPPKRGKGGIPAILTTLTDRVQQFYDSPRTLIPSLDLANESLRQMRGERREGCIRLLSALLKYLDLASLRVGFPTRGGFMNLTVPLLATHAGLGQKRAERALRDLKRAGLVTVVQARHLSAEGQWVGLAAVKTVSKTLFGLFGLHDRLKRERKKADKRLKQRQAEWAEAGMSKQTRTSYYRNRQFLESLKDKLTRSVTPRRPGPQARAWQHNPDLIEQGLEKMLALEKERPQLSRDERYRLTQQWLQEQHPRAFL